MPTSRPLTAIILWAVVIGPIYGQPGPRTELLNPPLTVTAPAASVAASGVAAPLPAGNPMASGTSIPIDDSCMPPCATSRRVRVIVPPPEIVFRRASHCHVKEGGTGDACAPAPAACEPCASNAGPGLISFNMTYNMAPSTFGMSLSGGLSGQQLGQFSGQAGAGGPSAMEMLLLRAMLARSGAGGSENNPLAGLLPAAATTASNSDGSDRYARLSDQIAALNRKIEDEFKKIAAAEQERIKDGKLFADMINRLHERIKDLESSPDNSN